MSKIPFAFLPFVLAVYGCGGESAATQQVRSAAAVDLGCNKAAIEIVEEAPFEKTVRGCGQTLVYSRVCGGGSTGRCYWLAKPIDPADVEEPSSATATAAEATGQASAKENSDDASLGGSFKLGGSAKAGGDASSDETP